VWIDFDWLPPPTLVEPSSSSTSASVVGVARRRSVEGVGEPLITDMEDVDYGCYLSAPTGATTITANTTSTTLDEIDSDVGGGGGGGGGECDILFPTDFGRLAEFAGNILHNTTTTTTTTTTTQKEEETPTAPWTVNVTKQSEFLETYGKEEVEQTKSWLTGYTPLLNDFGNCSVLTVSRRRSR